MNLPHIKPLSGLASAEEVRRALTNHDSNCSYVLRGGGDCDCVAQIERLCPGTLVRHVEPPIARQAHLQEMIRGLRRDRDMYRKLLADTEQALADYEVMAGVPF